MACDAQQVYRPAAARFEYSDDQQAWTIAQERIGLVYDGSIEYERWLLEADIKSYGPHRYWRVTLDGSAGWLLVSEFEFMAGIDDEVDAVKVADSVRTSLVVATAAPIAANKIVAQTSSGLVTADCTKDAHAGFVCGVSTEAKGGGESLAVQTAGVYIFPDGTFSKVGTAFLGAAGSIVTIIPVNAKFVQAVEIYFLMIRLHDRAVARERGTRTVSTWI